MKDQPTQVKDLVKPLIVLMHTDLYSNAWPECLRPDDYLEDNCPCDPCVRWAKFQKARDLLKESIQA